MKLELLAKPRLTRAHAIYAGSAVLILVTGLAFFLVTQRGESETSADNTSLSNTASAVDARTGTATLFYVSEDGMALVEYEQELPIVADDNSLTRARIIVEHQLGDAPPPLASPFPRGTMLRAIYLTPSGDGFVDLNLEATQQHTGGSLDELFTIYALVNALTTNVPEISAVQILIEGREMDTLAGHIDLRHPLERNMKWVARTTPDTAEG